MGTYGLQGDCGGSKIGSREARAGFCFRLTSQTPLMLSSTASLEDRFVYSVLPTPFCSL